MAGTNAAADAVRYAAEPDIRRPAGLARLSSSWLLSTLAFGYIWLFRSLPLIVVLIILYNFSYLYDTLSFGIPFTALSWALPDHQRARPVPGGGDWPDAGAERV